MPTWRSRLVRFLVSLSTLMIGSVAHGQEAAGSITGSVVDAQGHAVPGATVTVINERTGTVSRVATSDSQGAFRVLALLPDIYTVRVEMPSFVTVERRRNVLNVSAQVSLGEIKLTLGERQEVVDVIEAAGTQVAAEDSQHTGLLTATQIEQIQTKGRDVMTLLRLLPGVRYEDDVDAMGESFGKEVPNVNGMRRHWNNVTVDGLNGNELSGTSRFASAINLDAISEVRILLNSYKAEFGRTGGANIQIVSRGGSSSYRGSAYWYGRRDEWNANSWANKRAGRERAFSHFDTFGFNFGGPVRLPGVWEQKEKKLFFFYSAELPQIKRPGSVRRWMMPTALERDGDFSQTLDSGGRVILIRDPLLEKPCTYGSSTTPADFSGCFPGNKIPKERIDPSVQNLLSALPMPNMTDREITRGNYNFEKEERFRNNRQNHLLRLDWKPDNRDTFFLTLRTFDSPQSGVGLPGTFPPNAARWGYHDGTYDFGDKSITIGHTRIFGSNLINEISAGGRRQTEAFGWETEQDRLNMLRSTVGWTIGQFNPELNPQGILPIARFGGSSSGVENVEFSHIDRMGAAVADYLFSVRDNLTYTRGPHAFKAGFYVDYIQNNEARQGQWAGNFNFARNTSNPFDTGHGFANGLLGYFSDYREVDQYPEIMNRAWLAEWYAQDTWKATRRLTVDYGVRFLWYTPGWQANDRAAVFVPERFDPAKAPRIYRPVRVGSQNFAQDPAGGPLLSEVYVGTFVPGTGDPQNGMVRADDPSYPRGFRNNRGIHPEPRIGFAYDVFGNAKTAVHMSAGLFHQATLRGGTGTGGQGRPFVNEGIIFYNNTRDFLKGNIPLSLRPSNANGIERDAKTPSAYKLSVGVQQDLGRGIVVDVSYVGTLGRHLEMQQEINSLPDGTRFLDVNPQNRDPRRNAVLPDEFLRKYQGFQDINMRGNWGTSNYNALQVQLNRRYSKGLQFSLAYSYSKALSIGDDDPSTIDIHRPLKQWHYAPADYNQAHSLVLNFTLDMPKASRAWDVLPVRALLDGWQLSGEYALIDGDWAGITLSTTDNFDFDGGDGEVRPVMVGKPELPRDLRNPETGMFRTDAFARPSGRGDYGNTPRNVVRNAGVDNLNLSIFKNFNLGRKRRATFRVEGFNVLNHTQYNAVDRTARFDANGNMVNSNFGRATGARRLREVQASVRLSF